jgi:hypothetical protein
VKHFHVFAVDPDGARALLEGDSTRALAAARRPSEYFWFDGETLQLLVDLDDRDRGAGFDWPAELHAQRERAAHVAATIAERVRTLSR